MQCNVAAEPEGALGDEPGRRDANKYKMGAYENPNINIGVDTQSGQLIGKAIADFGAGIARGVDASSKILAEATARERKNKPVEGSYTNKLLCDKSLSKAKVLEEIDELIEAVEKNTNKIHEAADVFYHLIMYLETNNIKIEDVSAELEKRKKQ